MVFEKVENGHKRTIEIGFSLALKTKSGKS